MSELKTKNFIEKARLIHNNKYDYSKTVYTICRNKLTIICSVHGDFKQLPLNHLKGNGCRECYLIKNKYTLLEFIEKAKIKHNCKYNYDKVVYQDSHSKIIITCPKHGDFRQTPASHLSGTGCLKCKIDYSISKQTLTTEEFVNRAKKIHGNKYNYSNTKYVNSRIKITVTCLKHGDFYQIPAGHLSGKGCPCCKSSKGELAIKAILDKHNITTEPQYRIPQVLNELYYDFYLPDYNLLIEFHGIQHYEYTPFFHRNGEDDLIDQKNRDNLIRYNARHYKYRYLEFNYKQLKHMSEKEFEEMVLRKILRIF